MKFKRKGRRESAKFAKYFLCELCDTLCELCVK
jgi:hypothetical protein